MKRFRDRDYNGYLKEPIIKAAHAFRYWLDDPNRTPHGRSRIVSFLVKTPPRMLHYFRKVCLNLGCFSFDVDQLIRDVMRNRRGRW